MKKRSRLEQLGDFVLGKGFYIVLLLCVATIGVSGYALVHNFTAKPAASSPARFVKSRFKTLCKGDV